MHSDFKCPALFTLSPLPELLVPLIWSLECMHSDVKCPALFTWNPLLELQTLIPGALNACNQMSNVQPVLPVIPFVNFSTSYLDS